MTRRKVIPTQPPHKWECPVCRNPHRREGSPKELAWHLAEARDEKHKEWRRNHGIQTDYKTYLEVKRMANKIESIILLNPEKYIIPI